MALALVAAVTLAPGAAEAQALAPQGQDTPQAVTPPRLIRDSPAVYPQAALDAHFHDAVSVILLIDVTVAGAVSRAVVDTPAGHGFDEAAVAAASKLQFEPATQGGRPIFARTRFRYVFKPPAPLLSGRCASRVTDAPLAGALVTVVGADGKERTTEAAADGTWSFADLPPGKIHVTVTAKGRVAEVLDEELEPGQETRVVLRLANEPLPAPVVTGPAGGPPPLEIEVKGERPPREVTKRTLDKAEIALIPGTNGDALKSLLSLPGVARPPPLSGNLAVRGSAPGDTPVFVAGTNIPILYHFGGLSSVIPTELLEKIDFYPGNYSAMYGRGTGRDGGHRHPRAEEGRDPRDGRARPHRRAPARRGAHRRRVQLPRGGAALVVRPLAQAHPREDRLGRHHRAAVLRLPGADHQGHQRSLLLPADVLRVERRRPTPPGQRLRRRPGGRRQRSRPASTSGVSRPGTRTRSTTAPRSSSSPPSGRTPPTSAPGPPTATAR